MNTATLQPISVQGVSRSDAYRLVRATGQDLEDLLQAATELRERRTASIISYSRKVFIPLTNLCRDRCGYCTFARDFGDPRAHTMTPDEVLAVADAGRRAGCKERLKEATAQAGFELRERLAIYPEFVREDRLQSLSAPVRSRVLALVDKTGLVPQEEERW